MTWANIKVAQAYIHKILFYAKLVMLERISKLKLSTVNQYINANVECFTIIIAEKYMNFE